MFMIDNTNLKYNFFKCACDDAVRLAQKRGVSSIVCCETKKTVAHFVLGHNGIVLPFSYSGLYAALIKEWAR